MNRKLLQKSVVFALSALLGLFVMSFVGLVHFGQTIQNKSVKFWGEAYDPDALPLPFEFPQSLLIPEGGPVISNEFSPCRKKSPILLMDPMRVISKESYEVLCDVIGDTYIATVNIDEIDNEKLRSAMQLLLDEET